MIVTYSYRLLPTKRQHRALEGILESQRELYNAALQERIDAYRKAGVTIGLYDQLKELTQWRQADIEARSVPANLQRATLKRLGDAYNCFFRRVKAREKAGLPRFRGRRHFRSFGFAAFSGLTFRNGAIRFRGMPGALRVHVHRAFPPDAVIRSCSFRRDDKAWRINFAIKLPAALPRTTGRAVGLDLGLTRLATLSDGGFIPSLMAARRAARRIKVLQRSLARKAKGSTSRGKARIRLARAHAAVARQRHDHLHQASARLVRDYDVIAVEALEISQMARGFLATSVNDASWSTFFRMLRYKAEKAGARIIEVDPHRTTQDCSGCGTRVPKRLGDAMHDCRSCGLLLDRDLNAAINILNRAGVGPGLQNVAAVRASVQAETSERLPNSYRRAFPESQP